MDPLSAATTVLSVMGVAIKGAREIYILAQGVRTAPAYIQRLATEMQGLYTVLATFQRLLENNRSRRDQIITDMLENLHNTLRDCIEVFKDIKNIMSPYLDSHGDASTGRWKGFLWATFKKDDVMALQQTLGSYRAMLNMSFSALSVLYASHTDDVVVKIDENTIQIKRNIITMQSDASRIDARLKLLQRAVKKLERHLNDQEREELFGEGKAEGDQDIIGTDSPSADIRLQSKRMSVASYNSSLRRSLRDLNSIISSSSAMSRLSNLPISASPELAEMDNSDFSEDRSQEDGPASGQEADETLEDDKKYRAFIKKTLTGLKVDEYSESELVTALTLEESSPALGELDDGYVKYRKIFDQRSAGYDWDSKIATPPIRARLTSDRLQLSPRPSNLVQDPIPPSLPIALHKGQVSESAIETIRKPETSAPAIIPVSNSTSLVLANFKNRIKDWKGHNPENFGDLIFHEVLLITTPLKKNPNHKHTYHIYLFERILLCCKPFSPKTQKRVWRSKNSDKSSLQTLQLRLKGRIYMSNVNSVVSHSKDGQYRMHVFWKGDHDEESFSIHFHDEDTMRIWTWHIRLQSEARNLQIESPFANSEYI
ncbi:hypothetical protein MMC17_001766 [Xylographa soralifera]|nr:hypothetical protein [Xylographa soralifera]